MSDVSGTTQPVQQQQVQEPLIGKSEQQPPDFFKVVWLALFSSLVVNQKAAEIHVAALEKTQEVEFDTNQVLGSYQYQTIASSDMQSSWNPYFAKVSETNDRIQAQINITQNTAAVEQQTGQVQQTNINTTLQDAAQALQLGYGIAKEISSITQQISTI